MSDRRAEASGSAETLQKIMMWGLGLMISGIGAWGVTTLDTLTKQVAELQAAIRVLSIRVDGQPPRDVVMRMEQNTARLEKLEDRIDKMAARLNKKLGIAE